MKDLSVQDHIDLILDWYKRNFISRFKKSTSKERLLKTEIESFEKLLYEEKLPNIPRVSGLAHLGGFYFEIAIPKLTNLNLEETDPERFYNPPYYKLYLLEKDIERAKKQPEGKKYIEYNEDIGGGISYYEFLHDYYVNRSIITPRVIEGLEVWNTRELHKRINEQGSDDFTTIHGKLNIKKLEVRAFNEYLKWLKKGRITTDSDNFYLDTSKETKTTQLINRSKTNPFFTKWLSQKELTQEYENNPNLQQEMFEIFQNDYIQNNDSWLDWVITQPEQAEKFFPGVMEDIENVIRNRPEWFATIVLRFPEMFPKRKITTQNLLGKTRKKTIQSYIDILKNFLQKQSDNEIIVEAINGVREELTEELEHWKSELKNIPSQQIKKAPKIDSRAIIFKDQNTLDKVFSMLEEFFPSNKTELKKALSGELLENTILFPSSQNKLVEVFRRLKYNNFLVSSYSDIKKWICTNFSFQFSKGKNKEVRPFNPITVHDILTKGKGSPQPKGRICEASWLPFKTASKLKSEKQLEKLE